MGDLLDSARVMVIRLLPGEWVCDCIKQFEECARMPLLRREE